MVGTREIAITLLVASLPLFATPVVVPVEQVHVHDTGPSLTTTNETVLAQNDVPIVSYENLSDRGQSLYERSIRSDEPVRVPLGEGADDWTYGDDLVIERPANSSLPPADEENSSARYDLMVVTTESPPLTSPAWLSRLAAVALGVLAACGGGYLYVNS